MCSRRNLLDIRVWVASVQGKHESYDYIYNTKTRESKVKKMLKSYLPSEVINI